MSMYEVIILLMGHGWGMREAVRYQQLFYNFN
jgi:hypothetical protein